MKTLTIARHSLLGASALILVACGGSHSAYAPPARAQASPSVTEAPSPNTLQTIADQLADSGDHNAAIPIYRHLAGRDGNGYAMNALANSLIAQGITDEAERVLNMIMDRGLATGTTWYNMGKIQLSTGRFDNALSSFTNALSFEPDSGQFVSGKAIALAAKGMDKAALAALAGTTDIQSLSNKALILAATGESEEAIALLEPVIRTGHATSRDRQNLAMAYLMAGKEEAAFKMARLDLDPATTQETFTFYRSLDSLSKTERMQALVTGVIKPEWTREETANFAMQESEDRMVAANRIVTEPGEPKPLMVAVAEPMPTAVEDRSTYELTEIPPLVEPEGWALQIGAYRTIKNLMRGWTILYRESGDLLKDIPPRRSEVDFGERVNGPKGFYYRLNAGPLKSFAQAKDLCKALRERGTKCWIRPPEATEGKLPAKTKEGVTEPKATTAKKEGIDGTETIVAANTL